eukprot:Skav200713  [mRNA]  locus=scaffold2650:94064:102193:- [translate_table: standard]
MQTPTQVGISGYGLVVKNTFLDMVEVQDDIELQPRSLTAPARTNSEYASGEAGVGHEGCGGICFNDVQSEAFGSKRCDFFGVIAGTFGGF